VELRDHFGKVIFVGGEGMKGGKKKEKEKEKEKEGENDIDHDHDHDHDDDHDNDGKEEKESSVEGEKYLSSQDKSSCEEKSSEDKFSEDKSSRRPSPSIPHDPRSILPRITSLLYASLESSSSITTKPIFGDGGAVDFWLENVSLDDTPVVSTRSLEGRNRRRSVRARGPTQREVQCRFDVFVRGGGRRGKKWVGVEGCADLVLPPSEESVATEDDDDGGGGGGGARGGGQRGGGHVYVRLLLPAVEAMFGLYVGLLGTAPDESDRVPFSGCPLFLSCVPRATLRYARGGDGNGSGNGNGNGRIGADDHVHDGFFFVEGSEVSGLRRKQPTKSFTKHSQLSGSSFGGASSSPGGVTVRTLPYVHLNQPRLFGELKQHLKDAKNIPVVVSVDSRKDPILSSMAANAISLMSNNNIKLQPKLKLLVMLIGNFTGGCCHDFGEEASEVVVSEAIAKLWGLIAISQHNSVNIVMPAGVLCGLIARCGICVFEKSYKCEVVSNLRSVLFKYVCDRSGIGGVSVVRKSKVGIVKVNVASVDENDGKEIVYNVDLINMQVGVRRDAGRGGGTTSGTINNRFAAAAVAAAESNALGSIGGEEELRLGGLIGSTIKVEGGEGGGLKGHLFKPVKEVPAPTTMTSTSTPIPPETKGAVPLVSQTASPTVVETTNTSGAKTASPENDFFEDFTGW